VKIFNYFKESYNELVHKVTWPSWEELQSSAIIVMVSTVIIAIVIALMDLGFKTIINHWYTI
jgi:preprotein translocase subunit SecE